MIVSKRLSTEKVLDWPRYPGGLEWHILMNSVLVEDMFDGLGKSRAVKDAFNKMTTKIVWLDCLLLGEVWYHTSLGSQVALSKFDSCSSYVFSLRRSWVQLYMLPNNKTTTKIVWLNVWLFDTGWSLVSSWWPQCPHSQEFVLAYYCLVICLSKTANFTSILLTPQAYAVIQLRVYQDDQHQDPLRPTTTQQ